MKELFFLITIDTLRYDDLYYFGAKELTTPFLHKLASKSFVFRNFYANSVPTFFAFPVIFSGFPPFWNGLKLGIPRNVSWVNKIKEAGFYNMAFIAENPALAYYYNFYEGFDEVFIIGQYYKKNWKNKSVNSETNFAKTIRKIKKEVKTLIYKSEITKNIVEKLHSFKTQKYYMELFDEIIQMNAKNVVIKVFEKLDKKIREGKKKIFVWIHFMDTHSPYFSGIYNFITLNGYYLPKIRIVKYGYKFPFLARKYNHLLPEQLSIKEHFMIHVTYNLHLASLNYLDNVIEYFFNKLSSINDYRKKIVITSDHGEHFGEHRKIYHEPFSLYNELIRIPFLYYDSNNEKGKIIEDVFSHQDIKTIIFNNVLKNDYTFKSRKYVYCEIPFGSVAPHSKIFDNRTIIGKFPILNGIIFNDGIKVLFNSNGSIECYNLHNDPYELIPINEKNYKNYVKEAKDLIAKVRREKLLIKMQYKGLLTNSFKIL